MFNLSKYNNNTVIIDEDNNKFSYTDLHSQSDMLSKKIDERSLVFCFCSNEKGSLLGYVTFINYRIVPVMLDTAINSDLLRNILEIYKPDYLWMPCSMAKQFGNQEIYSAWDYSLLKTDYNHKYVLHDDLALLLTTSGSTGSPKLVRQSYKNILANIKSIVEYLKLDETERPITTLPMNYTYGLSIINSHLYIGASIILTNKTLMQKEFWQQFIDYKATSFGGVPYTYEMLYKLRFFKMELPYLRTMTQAGGKLSPELHKKFAEYAQQYSKRFFVMYGQTEATARMSYLPYDKALEKYGSMGIAIPGGEFLLIDDDKKVINEPEVVGELVYKGDNVAMGYAEQETDLSKSDDWNGILVTGDMAKRDKDGFYYITGRKKRFLKLFGNRVNLDDIERLLKTAFSQTDFACSGADDKMNIFITDKNYINEVISFLSEKTGINRIAFNVIYIKKIPRNESGKILYSKLS